jgi:hypothetical protein
VERSIDPPDVEEVVEVELVLVLPVVVEVVDVVVEEVVEVVVPPLVLATGGVVDTTPPG